MSFDRTATLRSAETLVRQGKIESAITEYLRVVDEQPRDWSTANTVGDLYVRIGQIDNALEQFIRIADQLHQDGFLPKAAAIYKKILKLKPKEEHALVHTAEIAAAQGLFADARGYLTTVIDERSRRGDQRGAAEARIRLGTLDPSDFGGRRSAVAVRVEMGDAAGAVRDLKRIAGDLVDKGRAQEAIDVLGQASRLAPDDQSLHEQLVDQYIALDDFVRARASATTAPRLKRVADALESRGRHEDALDVLSEAARLDPNDAAIKAQLAAALGPAAEPLLTAKNDGENPDLLFTLMQVSLHAGNAEEACTTARHLLTLDPGRCAAVAEVGAHFVDTLPDTAFAIVGLVADLHVADRDLQGAAAVLEGFVARATGHLAALTRLADIAVEGGLETTLQRAQEQLADAYLEAGMAAEAGFVAEDLMAREPAPANVDRFRRALVMQRVPDPDAIIAALLSGSSTEPIEEPIASEQPAATEAAAIVTAPTSHTIDIGSLLDAFESDAASSDEHGESAELDLNAALDDLDVPVAPSKAAAPAAIVSEDIDDVFAQLRDEAGQRQGGDAADGDYQRALVLRDAGDIDGCIEALERASRTPRLRFVTASLLGRLLKERGEVGKALEWLEQAAQAPAPTPGDYHEVLYELADGLEASGETARALAVCLELQTDAGAYRDVGARVDRLARVQAEG